MSLEEIQKLKEELGLKAYNRALGRGEDKTQQHHWNNRRRNEEFKRENKNRPREMSSKRAVPRLRDVVGVSSEQVRTEKGICQLAFLTINFDL